MSDPSVLTEAAVLTQVNKWVGVIIALIGALIAAPDGARLLFQSSATWIRAQVSRFRKPSPQTTKVVSGTANMSLPGLTATVSAHAWRPNDPIDDRIEALRAHLSDLGGRLNQTAQEVRQERTARKEALAELSRTFQEKLDELHQLLKEKDRKTATIDARGLPVIGTGIFLNGVPEALAGLPLRIGWFLAFGGFAIMIVALMGAIQAHRAASRTPPV
ncbi:hypothetical protein OIE13_06035 [Streptosporangium sp. NBC_01810]|uniref:hypothetical protein n=1 Tax=Streptosporangium sp. NBC_01810 TaxID=2975951 RepID=UPI002DDA4A1A|nr:hypothetical protein [Streptosporangium sp. NBC_01810]WSA27433.1 hypothetical protein OIE13_06035 [Streptosporangium sp. NBC_01810]